MAIKEIIRIYFMSDANMLEKAYYIYTCLTHDLADFTLFAAKFTEAFAEAFLAAIEEAQNAPQDNQIIDILAQKTESVNKAMEDCRKLIGKMRYFLEEAFKNNTSVLNEFGYNDYQGARSSQTEMQRFMKVLIDASAKYSVDLIAAGFDQHQIDDIQTNFDKLLTANNDQEYYKGERQAITQQRIEKMNAAWEIVLDVCKAGKIIYAENPAKYKQYVLYESQSGSGSDVMIGNVPSGQTVVIMTEGITPSTVFGLENDGQADLKFCLEDNENPCTSGIEVAPGDEQTIIANELGSGTILKATNLSDTVEGHFRVTVS